MTIKIEYCMCENFKDVFGRYGSNFRKTILLDGDGNIISEVFEENPHVRSSKDFAGVSVYDPNGTLIYYSVIFELLLNFEV